MKIPLSGPTLLGICHKLTLIKDSRIKIIQHWQETEMENMLLTYL